MFFVLHRCFATKAERTENWKFQSCLGISYRLALSIWASGLTIAYRVSSIIDVCRTTVPIWFSNIKFKYLNIAMHCAHMRQLFLMLIKRESHKFDPLFGVKEKMKSQAANTIYSIVEKFKVESKHNKITSQRIGKYMLESMHVVHCQFWFHSSRSFLLSFAFQLN